MALDQIAANLRQTVERADLRAVDFARPPCAKVSKEGRPGVFARPNEDGVRVLSRFARQRRNVQATEANVRAPAAVMIGDFVRPFCGSDVNLNDHQIRQIRLIIQIECFHVLVLQPDIIVFIKVSGERG